MQKLIIKKKLLYFIMYQNLQFQIGWRIKKKYLDVDTNKLMKTTLDKGKPIKFPKIKIVLAKGRLFIFFMEQNEQWSP